MFMRDQIISAIQQLNRSAHRDWLETFATSALKRYLDHLEITVEPRGRASRWIRARESPAVVTRSPLW